MTMLSHVTAQTRRQPVDLLVAGGTIVTMDQTRRVIDDGGIAVSNGRIVAIGPRGEIESRYTSRQKINATGKVVTPGLINGHTHVPMVLFRGLADDLDLQEWLNKYIFPAEAKNVTEEFVRVGTRLGLAEMIRGGTTTYCDMYYFEDAIADETAKAGVRGVLGETIIDFPVADNKTNAEGMAYVEKFVARWKGHELIIPAIAPHAPYTVSEEHLKAARAFSDRTGAPIVPVAVVGSEEIYPKIAELPQLANMNRDAAGVDISLRRAGDLVILDGRADLDAAKPQILDGAPQFDGSGAGAGDPEFLDVLPVLLRHVQSCGFTSICAKDAEPTGVGEDPDAAALRERLVGQNARDVEQLLQRVGSDHARLMEESVDRHIAGRQAAGMGRGSARSGLGSPTLHRDDRLVAGDPPRDAGELAGITE